MFHGTADPLVPYQWAVNTLDEAHAAGLVSYLTTYQGEGHVPFDHTEQIIAQTTNFLYWMLDLRQASNAQGRRRSAGARHRDRSSTPHPRRLLLLDPRTAGPCRL